MAKADGADRRDDGQRHPRLSDVHPQPHHRLFHDAQHPGVPRPADLAPDSDRFRRGKTARLQRSRNPQKAARRGGRVQGRHAAAGHLPHLVGLHGGADRGIAEEQGGSRARPLGQIAQTQGKGIIDAFLDLVVEENLDTEFLHGEINVDEAAMAQILTYPNALIGLSDGGAHVQFQSGFGFSTRLFSEWVREKKVMSLEQAVRRLTFDSASIFGLYDRGLLRPGMAADITIFDPDTVRPLPLEVSRFPDRRQAHQRTGRRIWRPSSTAKS